MFSYNANVTPQTSTPPAIPAIAPLTMNAPDVTLGTLIRPALRAAKGFMPLARILNPVAEYFITHHVSMESNSPRMKPQCSRVSEMRIGMWAPATMLLVWGKTCVGSCSGPRTRYDAPYVAMKLSMIVLITSSTANRDLNHAAIAAQIPPAIAPATSASGSANHPIVAGALTPIHAAAVAPAMNWPSAPIFQIPARNAIATARPVIMSGVAGTSVSTIKAVVWLTGA